MTDPSAPSRSANAPSGSGERSALVRAGVAAWSVIGIVALATVLIVVLNAFKLVVIPLLIALFPAAVLTPWVARLQQRGLRPMGAVAVVLGVFLVGLLGTLTALVWLVFAEFGDLLVSVDEAYLEIVAFVEQRFDRTLPALDDLVDRAQQWAEGLDIGGTATNIAFTTVEILAGIALGVFALFFYLKDASRMRRGIVGLFPANLASDADTVLRNTWSTIGGFFRGQLLVAAVDAVLIGIGLAILGVPLAAPLTLLVFFGGLFPIVGAFIAGAVAVLVALGEGGLGLALAVLVLNVVVQQVEGNLLQPVIVGRVTRLHPLAVIVAVTAGAVILGILGAFLAVPLVAAAVQALDHVRNRGTLGSGDAAVP